MGSMHHIRLNCVCFGAHTMMCVCTFALYLCVRAKEISLVRAYKCISFMKTRVRARVCRCILCVCVCVYVWVYVNVCV